MATKIIAATKEEFEKLETKLNELPAMVQSNVDTVEQAFDSPRYTFNQKFDAKVKIYVPKDITYISHTEEEISILCKDSGWFVYPYSIKKYEIVIH